MVSNFDRRREISSELGVDQEDRMVVITEFDKQSQMTSTEINNLQK
jgi:hypothetical protein